MKYKVIQPLEIKLNPSSEGKTYGVLQPSFIIDTIDEVEGTEFDKINKWLRDSNGFFYWKGAVEEANLLIGHPENATNLNLNLKAPWLNGNFDVSSFWAKTSGKGVTVAVIDTGIYPHSDIKDGIDYENSKYFVGSSTDDSDGHGTHVAGIIGARGKSDFIGVAPEVKIVSLRVVQTEKDKIDNSILAKAINYAASLQQVQIINISLGTSDTPDLKASIDNAIKKGKIIVASSGNTFTDNVLHPAYYDNVIAVSAVGRASNVTEKYELLFDSSYGERVNICCMGYKMLSCDKATSGVIIKSGTSMAAAFLSGLIALKLQLLVQQGHDNNIQSTVSSAIKSAVFENVKCKNSNKQLPVISISKFLT